MLSSSFAQNSRLPAKEEPLEIVVFYKDSVVDQKAQQWEVGSPDILASC